MGYEIPTVLRQVYRRIGLELNCAVYRLWAVGEPDGAVILPYFRAAEERSGQTVVFGGVRILQAGESPVVVEAEEAAILAWLSDRSSDRDRTLSNGIETKASAATLSATMEDGAFTLSFHLAATLSNSVSEEDRAALESEIVQRAESLLLRLTEADALLPIIEKRLERDEPAFWSAISQNPAAAAKISVKCTLRGEVA